jgi:hypothetical protein
VDAHGDLLYHYTTSAGFLGIIRDQNLRATNFSFLNDSSEVKYGIELISSVLEGLKETAETWPEGFDPAETLAAIRGFRDINQLYVACFTTLRNDLSQWRAYGSADVDRFCLGFTRNTLSSLRAPKEVLSNERLVHLVYELEEQRSSILRALRSENAGVRFAHEWTLELSRLALGFKHPSFHRESEWRIAVSTLGAWEVAEFDATTRNLRPFIPLTKDDGRLPIEEVLLLPSRAPEQALKAAELAMQRYGYPPEKVQLSDIPFVG